MPERYFAFSCCRANASISASTKKSKNFDPCACAYAWVKAVFTAGEIRLIVFALVLALVLASLAKTRQSTDLGYGMSGSMDE